MSNKYKTSAAFKAALEHSLICSDNIKASIWTRGLQIGDRAAAS